jgi:hypothetical protein
MTNAQNTQKPAVSAPKLNAFNRDAVPTTVVRDGKTLLLDRTAVRPGDKVL